MKNVLNISSLNQGAQCSLCQDTLLRHINQSRIFWYCPSCRQEMVGEGEQTLSNQAAIANCINQTAAPQRQLTKKVADSSVRAS